MNAKDIFIIMLSYGLGCFNTGYYYVRIFYKQDIRKIGTNVTGAYNVGRLGGKFGFIITFLGDGMKGVLPVLLCRWLELNDIVLLTCILMVLIGHIFPIQLKFKGGKGLSTAFGAFLAFHPMIILFWFVTYLLLFILIRRSTITCLFALLILPLEFFIADAPLQIVLFFILYALIIIYASRSNIKEFIKERAYQGSQKRNNKNL